MVRINWNPEWDTGSPYIDEQHHRLLAEFNDFLEAVQTDIHARHVKNLLEFLVDFLDMHFEDEEIQMQATRYPDLKRHKAFHDRLRVRVQTLVEAFQKEPEGVEAKVVALVQDWMDHHIGVEDKKMAKYFLEYASQGSKQKS